MRFRDGDVLFRSTLAASLSIATAMLAVLLIGLWGAHRELTGIRVTLLNSEITRLRSHGIRTVARLESELERPAADGEPASLRENPWLQRLWGTVIPRERERLYAAVTDATGTIVMHSDEALIGRRLSDNWKLGRVEGDGGIGGVFETQSPSLSGGRPAFDIVIPIEVHSRPVGFYHSGFDRSWFEAQVDQQQRPARNRWILMIGSIFAVVLLAAVSLHRINRRSAALQQAISMAHVKQLSDLGRLVGALAHEIRNPLNAIRLNLHALRNVLLGTATLSEDEIQQAIEESNREIERLSELMKTMLGYARPDQALVEEVDLNAEVAAMGSFLAPIMERDEMDFEVRLPDVPVTVSIDPDRLRQVLLNLVNNAREAAGSGGHVSLTLSAANSQAEIVVADDGPGVPSADRDRIFDPFYSTRETGTGLGLALVKRFVGEAGGSVTFEDRVPDDPGSGTVFRVVLPRTSSSQGPRPRSRTANPEVAGVA